MKKTLALLAALALTTAGTTFAQTTAPTTTQAHKGKGGHHQNPGQKADKMAKELGLNADQKAKLEQLMQTRKQESAALKAKYGADKKAGKADMKAAHDRYEAQLKTILTPEQYAKFDKMKAEHHGKGKDGGKAKAKA
jgi:Spy/CpxP family protein refolding chaperone